MRIISLAGARPNFMKIAPIAAAISNKNAEMKQAGNQYGIGNTIVHSGQHYDPAMSDVFLKDLNIRPDIFLGVKSGSHAYQTAKMMMSFEALCFDENPDLVLLVGDVNTTLAGALVASKLHIPIAHVEAGLRSFDRSMPEEINRVITDSVSDLLFITETIAKENLLREGVPQERIFFVGNVMIDSLRHLEKNLNPDKALEKFQLRNRQYALMTLHRPENVDDPATLISLLSIMNRIQEQIPVVFPVHPRTRIRLNELKNVTYGKQLLLLDPVGYEDFISLMKLARFVITDSGGIQEETTALNIPCITVRESTERPVTVTHGTNVIAGQDREKIFTYCEKAIRGEWANTRMPELWDGKAAGRIVEILCNKYL